MRVMTGKNNQNGSVLVIVLFTMVVLSIVGYSLLTLTTSSNNIFFNSYKKTKLHLEGEGVIRGFARLTQSYVENQSNMSVSLKDYIGAQIDKLTPENYTIISWDVTLDPTNVVQNLPSGPFKGMQADTVGVHYDVELMENASGIKGNVTLDGIIAGIAFTQFASFSFRELYLFGDIPTVLQGRVHGNDLVCIGANPAQVQTITSGGEIQHTNQCYPYFATPKTAFASADGTMANLREITPTATSGCTNCDGTGLDWSTYALARWNGNVLDSAHGVPKLMLKYEGTPVTQSRQTDWSGTLQVDPQPAERLLVDPPLPSDTSTIRDQKLAHKADIRIINGVWYIKDPADEKNWPGIPVWSDHPGHFAAFEEEGIIPNNGFNHGGANGVGQEDIRNWLNTFAAANAWPAGTVPKFYSYYEFDPTTNSIADNTEGVISYGGVVKKAANDWVPGHFVSNDGTGNTSFCGATPASCTNCSTPDQLRFFDTQVTCSNGTTPATSANLLNSTRSGFRFNLWEYYSMPVASRQPQSKVLPVNFDLKAFQRALECQAGDHPGEIGCFFKPGGFVGRPFNGIVYITNTWKGAMNTTMTPPPFNHNHADTDHAGNNDDTTQITVTHPAQHSSLPFELCSDSLAGSNFDNLGLFKIPSCARYDESTPPVNALRTRPSWVRIINAAQIDSSVLPKGISLVSNLQVYTVGDVNSGSETSPGGSPWSPILIAGDQVIPLSNNWSDHASRWDVSALVSPQNKIATDTTLNMAMISGQGTMFMLNENWAGKRLTFRGPAIQPFDALNIYMRNTFANSPGTFQFPIQDAAYDSHYELINNQPPGIPLLSLFSIASWL